MDFSTKKEKSIEELFHQAVKGLEDCPDEALKEFLLVPTESLSFYRSKDIFDNLVERLGDFLSKNEAKGKCSDEAKMIKNQLISEIKNEKNKFLERCELLRGMMVCLYDQIKSTSK